MLKGLYYIAPDPAKPSVVYQFIKKQADCYGIIVCQTRRDVDTLTRQLKALMPTQGLHGSISKVARDNLIENFKRKRIKLLILTEGFGSEISLEDIDLVLYYHPPQTMDLFHRYIDQLSRLDPSGAFYCLLTPAQQEALADLEKLPSLELSKHPTCLMNFQTPEEMAEQALTEKNNALRQRPPQPPTGSRTGTQFKNKGNQPSLPSRWV
jgi:superfamily II DNA/RNA helicase